MNSVSIPELYRYFTDKHLIAYFIDFVMEKSSPLNIYPKKYSIGTKSNPVQFDRGLQLIFFLVKRVTICYMLELWIYGGELRVAEPT